MVAFIAAVIAFFGSPTDISVWASMNRSGTAVAIADTIRNEQWQLSYLHAQEAWRYSRGANETVAVIDSGVDANHPDLAGQVLPGKDFVDGSTDGRTDVVGHGTTVAALIAGKDDKDGVEGLAPNAKILPVRVLDSKNEYNSANQVADAVRWSVDNGATVINMSLGSSETSAVLSDAVRYAMSRDVVVVACDGNVSNGRGTQVWHPAREPGVIAVSGVNSDSSFWSGSIQGPSTVLSAPANDITGADSHDSYWNVKGTSFASPLVAATAALVRSRYPTMSANNVINRLTRTAWDMGAPGRDSQYGFGVVNPTGALTAQVPNVSQNPLVGSSNGQKSEPSSIHSGPSAPHTSPHLAPLANRSTIQVASIAALVAMAGTVGVSIMAATWLFIVLSRRRRRQQP